LQKLHKCRTQTFNVGSCSLGIHLDDRSRPPIGRALDGDDAFRRDPAEPSSVYFGANFINESKRGTVRVGAKIEAIE